MPRLLRANALLLALAAAACATSRTSAPAVSIAADTTPLTLDAEAAAARAAAASFIASEAAGEPGADSLLAGTADFISTGIAVTTRPRLAGMTGTGTGLVEAASTGLAGDFAWVVVVYRFESRNPALAGRGRATMLLEKQRAGWRIRHVHSSAVERW